MEHNQDKRRGHFHRGRRSPDRRGPDRRTPSQMQERQPPRDQVDVEQIMKEIRGRVAQRQGVDLTGEQIQDLAARRLESILDPRAIKASLLETLRRQAGAVSPTVAPKLSTEPAYSFEDTTLYDSHRSILRFIRKLLNPLLKLFFNPNPLIRALHLQAQINVNAAAREAERDQQQAEWNALHYEILQRLVGEISRVSIEVQALTARVESLGGRVDFNDRRVRSIEATVPPPRPPAPARPHVEGPPPPRAVESAPAGAPLAAPAPEAGPTDVTVTDGVRRRRRRRRGRRGGATSGDPGHVPPPPATSPVAQEQQQSPSEGDTSIASDVQQEAVSAPQPPGDPVPDAPAPYEASYDPQRLLPQPASDAGSTDDDPFEG